MKYELVNMTAERAERLLELNTNNRKIRPFYAKNLARQMSEGLWQQDGEPIRVSSEGVLLDGQHRLVAVIESGATIPMLLITGVDPSTLATIDTGIGRNFADILSFNTTGLGNTTNIAAIVKVVNKWRRGARAEAFSVGRASYGKYPVDNQTLLTEYQADPSLFTDLLRRSNAVKSARRSWRLTGTVISGLMFAFDAIDRDDSYDFFEKLKTGAGLEEGDPILAAIRWADRLQRDSHPSPDTWAAILIKAWNKYRSGTKWVSAVYRKGGSAPESFPEPI